MDTLKRSRYALCAGAAAALLAGCAQLQPVGGPAGSGAQTIAPASSASGPLLYVAHASRGGHLESEVAAISLPSYKVLARITGYGYIDGVCSDASGNVWVSNLRHGSWFADKFAHGGTKAIDELAPPPQGSSLAACAVDSSSGDLAVVNANLGGSLQVLIWKGARSGKPSAYSLGFCPVSTTYDGAGNLFVTGWGCGSDFNVYFAELRKGAGRISLIKLDKRTGALGAVQWDGSDVVVGTIVGRNRELYRVQVAGKKGRVVGVVRLPGFFMCCFGQTAGVFALQSGEVFGMAGTLGERVDDWPYPSGGKPVHSIARYRGIDAIALSQ